MSAHPADIGFQIAQRAAETLIREGADAGLPWMDIAIAAETLVATTVAACALMAKAPDQVAFVTEIIDELTLRAHSRALDALKGASRP